MGSPFFRLYQIDSWFLLRNIESLLRINHYLMSRFEITTFHMRHEQSNRLSMCVYGLPAGRDLYRANHTCCDTRPRSLVGSQQNQTHSVVSYDKQSILTILTQVFCIITIQLYRHIIDLMLMHSGAIITGWKLWLFIIDICNIKDKRGSIWVFFSLFGIWFSLFGIWCSYLERGKFSYDIIVDTLLSWKKFHQTYFHLLVLKLVITL
jgi:hypothetical protein